MTNPLSHLTNEQQKQAFKEINAFTSYYKSFLDDLRATKMFHTMIDQKNEDRSHNIKNMIKCGGSGCSGCCHIPIKLTAPEAELILEECSKKRIRISKFTLEMQAKIKNEDEYVLSTYKRCVFLGEQNECLVYSVRPFACRLHNSVLDPKYCNTDNYPKHETQTYFDVFSFLIPTAAMRIHNIEFMAVQLLKLLSKSKFKHLRK